MMFASLTEALDVEFMSDAVEAGEKNQGGVPKGYRKSVDDVWDVNLVKTPRFAENRSASSRYQEFEIAGLRSFAAKIQKTPAFQKLNCATATENFRQKTTPAV